MKQKKIYIAIADSFPASTMNVVPFTTRKKAAAHVIERIRKYIEGTPWNPDHWTGYGKTGEHHIDAMYNIDFSMDDAIVYNDHVETSAIFGIAVRNMDDPANAEFGVFNSPVKPAVESLARALWDGMANPDGEVEDDIKAATGYLRAMFPEVEVISEELESFYFDYDGVEYDITLKYDRDENNQLHGGKIIVSNYDDTMEPVTIDRDTPDVKGTLEKYFKKAKSAGDSPDSDVESLARTLWDGMYDRSSKLDDDLKAATDYIRAMFPGAENIRYTFGLSYFDYDGGKYFIRPEYSLDEKGKVQYAKIIVREYDCKLEPVSVDRDTRDVKGTLEKFFKKAKSAGNSKDSTDSHAANLWESMADPDSDECADTNAALVYLESVLPQADIRKTGWALIQLEYKGMEYSVSLHYFHGDEDDSYILFFNKQSGSADLRIYRDTENPDEQIRKLFESPDSPAEPSLTDRVTKLEAVVKTLNSEIRKIKKIIKK